jgi:hypothetical protein
MSYGVFTDIAYINYQWSNFVRRSDTLNYIEKLDFSVYPNPSNNSFSLEYNLDEKQLVEISIYNIFGQRLWILKEDFLSAGNYVTSWDGRGRDGNEYSGGIYFLRLKIGNEANTKKIILLR